MHARCVVLQEQNSGADHARPLLIEGNIQRGRTLSHLDLIGQMQLSVRNCSTSTPWLGAQWGGTGNPSLIPVKLLPSTVPKGLSHTKRGAAVTTGEQGTHLRRLVQTGNSK